MVIAIDGPGGVGKSTVSQAVADRLGLHHLDSGSFYRAATLAALQGDADPEDGIAVVPLVTAVALDYQDGVLLDGQPAGAAVRRPEVTAAVSAVSAHAGVRDHITAALRDWVAARDGGVVVEGRDIGSVVFPDAELRIFLDARPEVRAARRSGDREAAGRAVDEIAADLVRRDTYDSSRTVAPLRPAEGAVIIDTSDLGFEQVVARVVELAEDAATAPDRWSDPAGSGGGE